jgi:predicted O-methyltransferase YrrM
MNILKINNMPKHYKKIHGHFNFEGVYEDEVNKATDGAKFLEIGCYLGKSTVYLAELIKESGKDITLYVIDTFIGEGNSAIEDPFYEKYLDNIRNAGIENIIKTFKGTSKEWASEFKPESLDFVYVDGLHTYDRVKSDIQNYLPKLKSNRIFAGHDYQYTPIRNAVHECLGAENLTFYNNTWKFHKK